MTHKLELSDTQIDFLDELLNKASVTRQYSLEFYDLCRQLDELKRVEHQ